MVSSASYAKTRALQRSIDPPPVPHLLTGEFPPLRYSPPPSPPSQVKSLPHGIDDYLMRTPRLLLRYPKAIQMQKNLLKVHTRREDNLHPTETNPKGLPAYLPPPVFLSRGPVGGPGGSQHAREAVAAAAAKAKAAAAAEAGRGAGAGQGVEEGGQAASL
jgi:hypothetical protein